MNERGARARPNGALPQATAGTGLASSPCSGYAAFGQRSHFQAALPAASNLSGRSILA